MNAMLSAVLTQFYRSFLAVFLLHLSSSSVIAGEDDFFIKDILKQQQQALPQELPDWLKTKPAKLDSELEQFLKQSNDQLEEGLNPARSESSGSKSTQGRWIFVSLSMPESELKAAAIEASSAQAKLVFRGVAEGSDTGSITKALYPLIKNIKPVPSLVIDPTLFTRFQVSAVPTVIHINEKGETRRVKGLPSFTWLSKQDTGNLGQRGPVYSILEPDMIEELKRRVRAYDWQKEKQHALDNFWTSQNDFIVLPSAEKNSSRLVDMSVVSANNIYHPDGSLIVMKGQKINPQRILPMRHAYVVFDGTNKNHVEVAKRLGDELLKRQKPVVFLFSKMNQSKGWGEFNKTQALLNGPVFKLNQTIVDRFKIRALPTLVEGDGEAIRVTEFESRELK